MSSRPWGQVVSINGWRQDVLSVKKFASRCPASSRSRQDVVYAVFTRIAKLATKEGI